MKKLTKSATDRQVSGVLGGIAEYFGIDSTIVRVIFLILVFAGVGSPVFLYILLAILLPEAKNTQTNRSYGNPYENRRPRKEAKPVKKEDDDWSDF
ncbi:PspC domain-containing protein [Jeotgalibaca ciconiae]|uniref:PspC domain-containing protein n=1 Tax=Jeotgalibaca ciconiae TaxID=2496265 RepID=A0A3S9HB40_9LACT|nr:PspC domain-containing protein [Jeotgalibaca ciconiae]AZP04600.1 PspC domain-containing protein [Jeotgalibaca ciconiae]HJB23360.1 PspC domain-containing protein [Candidatus Jeotgalibaca pullicola]